MIYRFGRFELNGARYELTRAGQPVPIEPRVLEVLAYLVAHRDRVVSKDELLDTLWQGAEVSESALTRTIRKARKLLVDPSSIKAVYGRGYTFEGPVEEIEPQLAAADGPEPPSGPSPAAPSPAPQQRAGPRERALAWVAPRRYAVAAAVIALVLALGTSLAIALRARRGADREQAAAPAAVRSIAVLPLRDLSKERDEGYFAAGLTEALITRLASLGALRVISRTSAMRYQETTRPVPEIARELGVDAVLVGSVLRSGNRVRVTVRLIHAPSDGHLWAGEYDREIGDILQLQAEIARAVVRAVELELTADEASRLELSGRVDPAAYRQYLLGRFHAGHRTIEGLQASVEHLTEAIRLDPGYAPAHAALADSTILLSSYYGLSPEAAFPRARAAAERALALDPLLSEAHTSLGMVAFALDWDFDTAAAEYRRALELAPGNSTAHQWYGEVLSLLARHDEAVAEGVRARELDPLSPVMHAALGQRLNAAGRWREALDQLASAVALEARFAWLHRERAYAHAHLGEVRPALRERLLEMQARGCDEARLAELRLIVADGDMTAFWRWELSRLEDRSRTTYVPALLRAEAWEGAGDRERALVYLARGVEERGIHVLQLTTSPELQELARDTRARALLAGAGLESPAR